MNCCEISSTFHYWYYLDLLLDRRFIHILNTFSISHFLIFRPNFDRCPFDELSFDENSTNGRVRRDVGFDGRSHSTKGLSTKCHGREVMILSVNYESSGQADLRSCCTQATTGRGFMAWSILLQCIFCLGAKTPASGQTTTCQTCFLSKMIFERPVNALVPSPGRNLP